MKKQISIGLLLFSLSENACVSMVREPEICYLAWVPKDVQDLIAQYLIFDDRETDDELIKRAQETARLPAAIDLCGKNYMDWPAGDVGCMVCIASYLTDKSKILYVEKYHKKGIYQPVVSLVDIVFSCCFLKIIYNNNLLVK